MLSAAWFGCSTVCFAAACTKPLTYNATVVLVYLRATAFCFVSSTLYYVFTNYVHADVWLCVDYFSIVCAI